MHTCPMVILLLVAVGMTTACSRQPEAMPNDSTEIVEAERERRMADVSGRWKKEKGIDDFHFLKDNWIKPGCTVDFAKEVLGDITCIRGNVSSSMLITGTPDDVDAECKRLIKGAGKGGGFILDGAIGLPDEAKVENVVAMAQSVHKYAN